MSTAQSPIGTPPADLADDDPTETAEWLEALEVIAQATGPQRAKYLLQQLELRAQELGVLPQGRPYSAYRNTIPLELQEAHPGELVLEEKITAMVRWNALAMVVRANQAYGELGGHIASYASAAEIFEIGMQRMLSLLKR